MNGEVKPSFETFMAASYLYLRLVCHFRLLFDTKSTLGLYLEFSLDYFNYYVGIDIVHLVFGPKQRCFHRFNPFFWKRGGRGWLLSTFSYSASG